MDRIGASRLFDLARVLEVPIGYFFGDAPEGHGRPAPGFRPRPGGLAEQQEGFEDDVLHRHETLELARAYYGIGDPNIRKCFFDLIKSMAAQKPQP